MNLRRRGVAVDAATAALDVAAAGRFLAAVGFPGGRVRVVDEDVATDDAAAASAQGDVVVRVRGRAARDAALATAGAFGLVALPGPPGIDGAYDTAAHDGADRLAARWELGLEPDETVQLVLGTAALRNLTDRLAGLDATLAADPTPRRLVLAGLPDHGPALGPDVVGAIVHPQVLVESEASDAALLAMLRRAADEVVAD
jgi:hypothetical protein